MTEDEQRAAGCVIGTDYPEPIVDHKRERERAMERYRAVRGSVR
jgi:deoxyribodipyrimidine photo-lyase